MADGSIKIDTKLDGSGITKGLKDIKKTMDASMKQLASVANKALIGIGTGIAGIAAASTKFAKVTDRIDKLSQSIGLSRKTFQELDYTFGQNGASIDALSMGMKTLLEKTSSNADAFKVLGVQTRNANGTMKTQDEILKETIRAFEGIKEGTAKATLAQDLFGRSAQDLMPTLNQIPGTMDALNQRAHELGAVLSDEVIDAGVKFGDTMDEIDKAIKGALNTAIAPLIPMITDAANGFVKWATEGDKLKNILVGFSEGVKKAWESGIIQALLATVVAIKAVTVAWTLFNIAFNASGVGLIITGIAVGIAALVAGIILVYKNWNKISTFIMTTATKIKQSFIILGSKINEAFSVAFNSVKIVILEIVSVIAGKLFTAILKVVDVLEFLDFTGLFSDGLNAARNAINGLSDGIQDATNKAKEASASAIALAKDKQDATEAEARAVLASLAAQEKATDKSIEKLEENTAIELRSIEEVKTKTEEQIAIEKDLADIKEDTSKTEIILKEKSERWFNFRNRNAGRTNISLP